MRGLHFQYPPYTQSKLVRRVKGAVIDVAEDIRKGSSTYGQHVSCLFWGSDMVNDDTKKKLSLSCGMIGEAIYRQFFVPRGFAVLSKTAIFQYKSVEFYHTEADGGISVLDDSLGLDWHIVDEAVRFEKDTMHPKLNDFDSPFDMRRDLYQ